MEELSYEEISRIMDYPLGTVKSAISRAREKLRGHLMGALEGGVGHAV
jgi:DNA-directed RNA polymerase specialized sigma24 family protein